MDVVYVLCSLEKPVVEQTEFGRVLAELQKFIRRTSLAHELRRTVSRLSLNRWQNMHVPRSSASIELKNNGLNTGAGNSMWPKWPGHSNDESLHVAQLPKKTHKHSVARQNYSAHMSFIPLGPSAGSYRPPGFGRFTSSSSRGFVICLTEIRLMSSGLSE